MPIIDRTVTKLNEKFSPEGIGQTVHANAHRFAPGQGLQLDFVFADDAELRDLLREYIETIPAGIQEAYRATLYQALSSEPPTPIVFVYEPAYDFALRVTETPNTRRTPGIITVTLEGRYASDSHPLAEAMAKVRQGARKSSTEEAKAKRKPAKRKPSKKKS